MKSHTQANQDQSVQSTDLLAGTHRHRTKLS